MSEDVYDGSVVCVGGPCDGDRATVQPDWDRFVLPADEQDHWYIIETMGVAGETLRFARSKDVSLVEAVKMMLEGYRSDDEESWKRGG